MLETSQLPQSDVRIVNVRGTRALLARVLTTVEQVASVAHRMIPDNVRYRGLEDFNQDYNDAPMPVFMRYCLSR